MACVRTAQKPQKSISNALAISSPYERQRERERRLPKFHYFADRASPELIHKTDNVYFYAGGIFHDCAVHDIDIMCWVLGEYPRRVTAHVYAHTPEIAAIGDYDTVAVVLSFPSGTIGIIDLSRNATYGYDQRLEVGPLHSQIFPLQYLHPDAAKKYRKVC